MEKITHWVSLVVGVTTPDDHAQVHQDFSELSRSLAVTYDRTYVASDLVRDPAEPEENKESELFFDEDTLIQVRHALARAGLKESAITDCISDMQNHGILFRERR